MNKYMYLRSKFCLTYCSFFCQEMLACCSLAGSNKKKWDVVKNFAWFTHKLIPSSSSYTYVYHKFSQPWVFIPGLLVSYNMLKVQNSG